MIGLNVMLHAVRAFRDEGERSKRDPRVVVGLVLEATLNLGSVIPSLAQVC